LCLQIFTRMLLKRDDTITISTEMAPHVESTNWEVDTRLSEARRELEKREEIVRWNRWTIHLLTFAQYVIGALLVMSFIETLLNPIKIGILGILLIGSCVIHQRFRPDIKLQTTCKRAVWLRGLIRHAEDMIFEMKRRKDVEGVHAVRQMVSKGLSDMEQSELEEITLSSEAGAT